MQEKPKTKQGQNDLCRYKFAMLEQTQGLIPGLYTPLRKAKGERPKRRVVHPHPSIENAIVQHRCYEAFGADDLKLHLAILSLKAADVRELDPSPATELGITLRKKLELEGVAARQTTATVRCHMNDLLEITGKGKGGSGVSSIRRGLERGTGDSMTVYVEKDGKKLTYSEGNALSYAFEETTGLTVVALHPILGQVLLGQSDHFRIVDLVEMRTLTTDCATILHTFLSCWIRQGEHQTVGIDTLAAHVYGATAETPEVLRDRRRRIREALVEIAGLPRWDVRQAPASRDGLPQVEIRRRKPRSAKVVAIP